MICPNCGAEDKNGSKFCKKCGTPLTSEKNTPHKNQDNTQSKMNNNVLIIAVAVVICVAIIAGAFVLTNTNSNDVDIATNDSTDINNTDNSSDSIKDNQTQKSWKLIDTYYGDGSGNKEISVPNGDIRLEFSAYPIKNYADNYFQAYSSDADLISNLEWNSHSPVEAKYDSFEYSSNSPEVFNIVSYELESWEVKVYQYF